MASRRSQFTVHAWVATTPEVRVTAGGSAVTTFRIADSVRRRDPETGIWSDSKTTWYTVRLWGDQGANVAESVRRSDPVIVTGHPWLEQWTSQDGEPMSTLVIDADSVSPDLTFGTSRYTRVAREAQAAQDTSRESDEPHESTEQDDSENDPLVADSSIVDELEAELMDDTALRANV